MMETPTSGQFAKEPVGLPADQNGIKQAKDVILNDQINRRISVDAINDKSTSRERSKFPIKV